MPFDKNNPNVKYLATESSMSEFYNESVADEELAGESGKLKQVPEEASDDYVRSSIRKELGYGIEERRTELQKEIEAGDVVEVDFDSGIIYDRTKGTQYQGQAFPEFMQKIIKAEGLINYINER